MNGTIILNKTTTQLKGIALFALMFLFVCSCSDDNSTNPDKDAIQIGVLLPLTGSGSSVGESMLEAINLAEKDINSNRGKNPKVKFIILDTKTFTEKALECLMEFNSMGIKFVVGPYSSAELEYISDYANENGIVLISPSSVAISLAVKGDNIFRLSTNDYHQVNAVSKYIEMLGRSKIVAVNRADVWGNSLYTELNERSKSSNFEITKQITYSTESADYLDVANQIKANIVDLRSSNIQYKQIAVYYASFDEGNDVLSSASYSYESGSVTWIGSSAFALNSTILSEEQPFNFAIKTNFTCPAYTPSGESNSRLESVRNKIKSQINREPESYAYTAYDAAYVAYNAANNIKTNIDLAPHDAVIEYCNTNEGITGLLELDDYGDRKEGDYYFWQLRIKDNQKEWFAKYRYNSKNNELIEVE